MDVKNKDEKYLIELQRFFDLTDNIEDEVLRKRIVYQMLKLQEIWKKSQSEK